ncbi:Copper-binding protein, plastocyanin/azurin family [Mesorhizobium loti]|nr:Copper-binding protein, plastocyanin/azurin family [Mesorhizobium loti]
MTMKIPTGLLVLALAFGVDTPGASAQPAPRTIRVDIHGFQFVPARVDANVGDTIEWTNRDFAPHTATDAGGKWTTATLGNGATGRTVVTTAGTFTYRCNFHQHMTGTIVVTGSVVQAPKS